MSTSLWQVWERTVAADPEACALVDSDSGKRLSRNELSCRAEELAAAFAPARDQVIAFAEVNGPGWFHVFLAIQKAGAIALPLDSGLPPERRAEAARTLGAAFLFDMAHGMAALPDPAGERPWTNTGEICLLKLTSGSTAAAKPLAFSSAQMLADGQQVCAGMGIRPEDVNFGAIPFGHSYGLGNLVIPLLAQGTAVAFSTEHLPGGIAEGIVRSGATVLPTVPAVLRGLTASSAVGVGQLDSVRLVISAGAFLRPDVATGFYTKFRKHIHGFYGSSETGGICYDAEGQATLTGRSVGRPLPFVKVELEAAEENRVRVTSPAATAPGTHLLADRAEWNEAGELHLLGRAGTIANVGGRKVNPAEVEQTLRALPEVTDAWVGVRTRAGGDDYLVAAVETSQTREQVLTLLSSCLPRWQMPRHTVAVTLLPRTERGKLDRADLEARFG